MSQLEPDDNTKWLGWRLGTEMSKSQEEITEIKKQLVILNKTLVEISIRLSELIESNDES